jgi:hypothetical protein
MAKRRKKVGEEIVIHEDCSLGYEIVESPQRDLVVTEPVVTEMLLGSFRPAGVYDIAIFKGDGCPRTSCILLPCFRSVLFDQEGKSWLPTA